TTQDMNERNFHIFYQLLATTDTNMRQQWMLKPPEMYYYLNQSNCVTVESQPDAHNFREVLDSFTVLGFEEKIVQCILAVTVAVLNIGNLTFDAVNDGEGSQVAEQCRETLHCVSSMLEVSEELL